jgi:hypothetical protein
VQRTEGEGRVSATSDPVGAFCVVMEICAVLAIEEVVPVPGGGALPTSSGRMAAGLMLPRRTEPAIDDLAFHHRTVRSSVMRGQGVCLTT